MDNAWIKFSGVGRPAGLAHTDSVMVRIDGEYLPLGPHLANLVDWARVVSYHLVPDAPMTQETSLLSDLAASRAEVKALRTSRDQMVTELADNLDKARAELERLGTQLDLQRQAFHDLAWAQMEHLSATHAGIKRGIEVGDLPPDYYGRFRTTWAPK